MFHTSAKLWRAALKQRGRRTYLTMLPMDIFTMVGHRVAPELYVCSLGPAIVARPAIRLGPHYILDGRDLVIHPCIDPDQYRLTIYSNSEMIFEISLASPSIAITARSIVVRGAYGDLAHLDRETYKPIGSLPAPGRALLSLSPYGEQLYYPNILVTKTRQTEVAPGTTSVCDGIEYIKKPNILHIHIGTYLIAKIPCDAVLRYDYPLIIRHRDIIRLYDNRTGKELAAAPGIPTEIARATLDSGVITICATDEIVTIPLILGPIHVPKKHSQIVAECIGRCRRHRYSGGLCGGCGLREAQYY